ncbi:MAG: SWIM zinc finger family protein, partial [Clostridia bacterium]|nr:SWIM zinc finger family protein [Clostridia bacterium]
MSYNYWDNQNFSQPTTEELKRKSEATRQKAAKSGNEMEPVVIEGTKITKKWWGNAWCQNLEDYADYESRLSRGKKYVRAGTVLDLKINKGKVSAKVQGSRKTPYKVEIRISPLSEEKCSRIIDRCGKKIQNLEDLILGNIPQEMQDVITDQDGLFPAPKEISMTCSCPDWAIMCKHVAATLYGIGARFDDNPLLFFELRGIDPNRFIGITLNNKVDEMLANEGKPSSRIIDDDDAWKL